MKSLGGTDVDLKPERPAAPVDAQKPGQPVSPDTISSKPTTSPAGTRSPTC
jgi:hypothetical protein